MDKVNGGVLNSVMLEPLHFVKVEHAAILAADLGKPGMPVEKMAKAIMGFGTIVMFRAVDGEAHMALGHAAHVDTAAMKAAVDAAFGDAAAVVIDGVFTVA